MIPCMAEWLRGWSAVWILEWSGLDLVALQAWNATQESGTQPKMRSDERRCNPA